MSLITRCPACQTLFKVVPDQLRISEGWVRCGRCSEIFDASQELLPDAAPEHAAVSPRPEDAPVQAPGALDSALPLEPQSPLEAVTHEVTDTTSPETAVADHLAMAQEEPASAPLPEPGSEGGPISEADALLEPVLLPQGLMAPASASFDPQSLSQPFTEVAVASDTQTELAAPPEEASFLGRDQGKSFWQRRLVRVLMLVFSVLLLLLLAGQMVFQERDRIVALQPGLKPWMHVFCQALDCSLSPLRQSEAIVIESSTFTKIRSDAYQLNFTLRNKSGTTVAMPSLELTLTDTQDQAVVRKVFAPESFGAKVDSLAANAELAGSLAVSFRGTEATDKVAGYRLLVFYP